jgi:hypothetical protein
VPSASTSLFGAALTMSSRSFDPPRDQHDKKTKGSTNHNQTLFSTIIKMGTEEAQQQRKWEQLQRFWEEDGRPYVPLPRERMLHETQLLGSPPHKHRDNYIKACITHTSASRRFCTSIGTRISKKHRENVRMQMVANGDAAGPQTSYTSRRTPSKGWREEKSH